MSSGPFDPWDGNPSPYVGTTNKWTANNQAPAPSYKFLNYLDWIIANYQGGVSSFTDTDFDVHNTTSTSNKVTLKFDLNPSTSGDTGIVTKYLSVPTIATEPPTPYHDEIVTKYATQTLYNKSFVGAIIRTHGVVPVSPGPNTISGGTFFGVCNSDDNLITSVTSGGNNLISVGAILPHTATVGSTTTVVNTRPNLIRVVPYLGDQFDSGTNTEPNAGNGAVSVFPYQSAPSVAAPSVLLINGYSVRTFYCTSIGVWKDISARLWNAPDFVPPTVSDLNRTNVMVYTSSASSSTTTNRWTLASNTQPLMVQASSMYILKDGASSSNINTTCFKFNLNSVVSRNFPFDINIPDVSGPSYQMVLDTASQTLSAKVLDNTCTYGGQITASNVNTSGATTGQVLTVSSPGPGGAVWSTVSGGILGTKQLGKTASDGTTFTANVTINVINQFTVNGGSASYAQLPTGAAGDVVMIINAISPAGGLTVRAQVGGSTPSGVNPLGASAAAMLINIDGLNWRLVNAA
jgi:hypothetical protein